MSKKIITATILTYGALMNVALAGPLGEAWKDGKMIVREGREIVREQIDRTHPGKAVLR